MRIKRVAMIGLGLTVAGGRDARNIHQSWPIDAVFYGLMGTGVLVLSIAASRKS
jgi:hypothetical protein